LRYVEGDFGVEQAIGIVLQTVKNERLLRPSFGAGLASYVFANNTPATQRAVENEVRRALLEWEPRIQVERVQASASKDEPSLLLIEIDYRVRQSNAFYNRVFPFYLSEGG
jgi:phage baseplate assembly protein W